MDMRITAFWLAALAVAGPGTGRCADAAGGPGSGAAHAAGSPQGWLPRDLLDERWLDDQGRPLALRSVAGGRVVLTMAYATCHRICPMTIHKLQALQAELDAAGERATFVVVGFDPDNDDPAAWHQYRRARGLTRPDWLFLTARDAGQARRFAQRLGFEFWRYDEHVMHDERVVVLAPGGTLQLSAGPGHVLHASDLSTGT